MSVFDGCERCWNCFGDGFVVRRGRYGKRVVPCPSCENRRLIREHKERLAREEESATPPQATRRKIRF